MSSWATAFVLVLAAAGCESSIVGLACQPEFARCGGECVNLKRDFRNCGGCGIRCERFSCHEGSCDDTPRTAVDGGEAGSGGRRSPVRRDASAADSDAEISERPDAAILEDAAVRDAATDADAAVGGCAIGQRECGGSCVNPQKDPEHCGGCGRACAENETCSAGACARACAGTLRACDGQCHDPMTDPDHCGGCGSRCASGICEAASCADAIAGQLVVIGHDFTSANAAMRRLAGNAVFLARGAPVRVLAYRGRASDATVRGVEDAIEFSRSEIGRAWEKIEATAETVPLQLAAADVLLIHAQTDASGVELTELGRSWATAIQQFLARGGIVVLFEAPAAENDGTFRILDPSRIFGALRRVEIPVQALRVQTPGLGVALRVPDRYMSAMHTVRFEGLSTGGTAIVVDQRGEPVVIQRVISP